MQTFPGRGSEWPPELSAEGVNKRCFGRTPVETSQPKSIELAKEDKRIEHPRVGKRSTAQADTPARVVFLVSAPNTKNRTSAMKQITPQSPNAAEKPATCATHPTMIGARIWPASWVI